MGKPSEYSPNLERSQWKKLKKTEENMTSKLLT